MSAFTDPKNTSHRPEPVRLAGEPTRFVPAGPDSRLGPNDSEKPAVPWPVVDEHRGFPKEEYEFRLRRAQELMEKAGIDSIFLTTEENFEYFSGLATQFWKSPTRPYFLILPREGTTPTAVVPSISYAPMTHTFVTDIHTWHAPNPTDDGVSLVIEALKKVPRKYGKVGMPMGHETTLRMPLLDFFRVQKTLEADSGIVFTDCTAITGSIRLIKSPREVAKIRRADQAASRAFAKFPARAAKLTGPLTELEITREFHKELIRQGVDDVPYLIGESGQGGYPSVVTGPTERYLKPGDIIVFDTGARYDNYWCDFDRNFSIGGPADPAVAHAHEMLWVATEKGIEAARPGNKFCDVFWAMGKSLEEQSNGMINAKEFSTGRFGHCIGRNITEGPSITPHNQEVIVEGMVISIEPGLSMKPFNGTEMVLVHEENVHVGPNGAELLSDRAPRIIPILYIENACTPGAGPRPGSAARTDSISSDLSGGGGGVDYTATMLEKMDAGLSGPGGEGLGGEPDLILPSPAPFGFMAVHPGIAGRSRSYYGAKVDHSAHLERAASVTPMSYIYSTYAASLIN